MNCAFLSSVTMAGLDPATQPRRACAARQHSSSSKKPLTRADARLLDDRVKPGHGEV